MTAADPLELVIFDCDGVLVDSEPMGIEIDLEMLDHFGLHMSREEVIDRFVGRSPSVMRTTIEEHLGRPLHAGWDAPFHSRLIEAYAAGLQPVDGIVGALDEIPHAMCVASSSEPEPLHYKLGLTGLRDRFDGAIFSATQVAHGKPAPDLFVYAAAQMGVSPARCAVVEDSQYGVQAARAAGMDAFGYAGGVTRPDTLRGERTVVFEDMRELPQLLARFR
jgi:HAD superfamily hydrolase (TIGR01509 family)